MAGFGAAGRNSGVTATRPLSPRAITSFHGDSGRDTEPVQIAASQGAAALCPVPLQADAGKS
jgi:hypothetical protein